ncbi:MAG: hypothetical protein WCI97_10975 [Bacteroidota bacterium]
MKQRLLYTLSFLIFSFLLSCKEDTKNETVTPIHSASLQITVLKENTNHVKHPLSGVTVYLFLSDYDRSQNQNVKFSGTVTDSGKISFNSLPDDYYFIQASHPTYGTNKSETATPDKTVSYEEIDY